MTKLGRTGENVSEDDDNTSSDEDSPQSCDSVADAGESDVIKLTVDIKGDSPLTFDDAFSADVELMKAMGLPLGFRGSKGHAGEMQEVVYVIIM